MLASALKLKDNDPLKKSLAISIVFHFGVFFVFTVKTLFFPTEPIHYKSAMKVDLVALPAKKIEVAEPVAKPAPVVEIKPKPTQPKKVAVKPKVAPKAKNLKKTKKNQEDALRKLKMMAAMDKLKEQKPEPAKGNILTPGTDLKGLNSLEFDEYLSQVDQHIKSFWQLPEWLLQLDLRASVLVKIDERGFVIENSLLEASGNADFDQRTLNAIQNSSPFPQPPGKFKDILGIEGVIFNFPE